MNAPTIVIEPTDSAVKIVVGYVLNKEPIVLYASTLPMSNLIKGGQIVDIKSLANFFRDHAHIEDRQARVRFDIKSAVLILPPVNLKIYEDKKGTFVVSNENRVSQIDIDNVVAMMHKSQDKSQHAFVDIIPTTFFLENGKTQKLPLGLISNYLGMKAIIYALPEKLLNGYRVSLESAGIKVKRSIIAPSAIAHLLANEKNTPKAYIFVDVGSSYTSMSLISKTFVYNSSSFAMGGDNLTQNIADAFNINYEDAEKLKRRYGYTSRLFSFNPIITSSVASDGKEMFYTIQDLNRVMKDYLENYVYAFDTCLNKLLSAYPKDKQNFPIIIGGAASRLDGFVNFIKNKYANHDVSQVPLHVIGTRHEKYLNCVGGILAAMNSVNALNTTRSIIKPTTFVNKILKK